MANESVDPDLVPKRRLYTGALMPAIGLGTFGSDHAPPEEVAAAVKGAVLAGYGTWIAPRFTGTRTASGRPWQRFSAGNSPRRAVDHFQGLERPARRCHRFVPEIARGFAARITWTCTWCTGRFRISIRRGAAWSRAARMPGPTSTRISCGRGGNMERLVELGLVRHIGTSNMTIPKLKLLLRDAAHQAGGQ